MLLYAKVPHYLADDLPLNRPYTRFEAWFQYDMDTFTYRKRSEREYSKMWSWSRSKVARFISEIGKKSEVETLPIITKTDEPKTSHKRAKREPLKQHENSTLQDIKSQKRATDEPEASQLYIRENKREETLSLHDLWNDVVADVLPTVREPISKSRLIKCVARLKERTLQDWEEIFRLMINLPFLCGCNDRGWKADFDWILSDGNAGKVLEGKYQKSGGRVVNSDNRYAMFAGA